MELSFAGSVTKLCPTLCNPMDCSMPGFPALHYLLEFVQTHVHWVGDAIQPFHPLSFPSFALDLFQHQRIFPVRRLFTSGGQNIGVSASTSVCPMNIQGWFHFRLTGLISLLTKGLSRIFSSTTVWKYQFFYIQFSLWSGSHIHTSLVEKP